MTVRILQGDCREVMRTMPEASVHCCVTSPPYWGLRDYGVDGQIGLEESVNVWVREIVDVFREVRRVLRDDGTVWLNLGDSYNTGTSASRGNSSAAHGEWANGAKKGGRRANVGGLKPKDLIGQPWLVAFALRADGWYLRQDIVWHKPNPMPESIRDRCTKAHEYVFLLSKSERYYYDFEAMQEPVNGGAHARRKGGETGVGFGHGYDAVPKPRYVAEGVGHRKGPPNNPAPKETGNAMDSAYADGKSARMGRGAGWRERKLAEVGEGTKNNASFDEAMSVMPATRNRRSVWTVPSEPFKDAHFATFPPALIEPCIAAGCPTGGTVLDPFGGAGTTGLVADRLQRDAVLIELNPAYIDIARRRLAADTWNAAKRTPALFAEVA